MPNQFFFKKYSCLFIFKFKNLPNILIPTQGKEKVRTCKKLVNTSKVKFMNLRIAWDDVIMMFGSMNSSLWLVLGSYISKLTLYCHPKHCQHIFTVFFFGGVTAIYIKYLKFAWISEWIIRKTLSLNNLLYLQKLSTMVTQYGTEDYVTLATATTTGKS